MFKKYVQYRLKKYVKKFFVKNPNVKLVTVSGSVGKTSTKRAIATVLSQRYRVAYQEGNHNTLISAPLSILGIKYPEKVHSIWAWMAVFRAARKRVKATEAEIIIQEIGTDRPGEIAEFGTFLTPDIAVITGITPEHMEFFGTLDAVAQEELAVASYAKSVLINRDDVDSSYANYLTNPEFNTYGTSGAAEYSIATRDYTLAHGFDVNLIAPEFSDPVPANVDLIGEHSLRSVAASLAVGLKLGLTVDDIQKALAEIKAVPGRMNLMKGIESAYVIDDSYNSSPAAATAALQTVYSIQAPQRIVLLGDMNELGSASAEEHKKVGELCDPTLLDWVVTVGPESEKYLAPAARARGNQVKSFASAIDAGAFVRSVTHEGALILVKGSQGGIFTEEAVKMLVYMSENVELVRQGPEWTKIKDALFSKF